MIYIGDGLTDVPCMKLVKVNGGQSIAVYQKRQKDKVMELLKDDRVDYIYNADYSENGELEKLVKNIVLKMVITDDLTNTHRKQVKELGSPSLE
jgi:hypothetical protein